MRNDPKLISCMSVVRSVYVNCTFRSTCRQFDDVPCQSASSINVFTFLTLTQFHLSPSTSIVMCQLIWRHFTFKVRSFILILSLMFCCSA